MKKALFLFSMLAFTLVSCEREADLAESESLPGKVTVKATMADAMRAVSASRTAILDESARSVCWTPRDEMSLFYGTGTGGGNKFVSKNTQNQSVADFEGTIGVVTAGADFPVDKTFFWGLYPYDPEAVCDGTSIVTTLSPNQTAVAGSFETGRVISIARSQNLGLSFYNVCSGLRVKVVKEGVVRMKLKSLDGSPLAGKARITMDDSGIPYVQEVLEGSDEITLSAPAGKYLEPGQNYYFMFFPHDFTSSFFTITFETMNETATYERKREFKFKRSDINEFSVPIDKSLTYSPKEGDIPIEDPAFKNWLISNGFDTDGSGAISYAEAEQIQEIWIEQCENYNIQSLQGIEYMPNLTGLGCTGSWKDPLYDNLPEHYYIGQRAIIGNHTSGAIGTLKKVDVSYNHKLVHLNVAHNEGLGETVGGLDLSNNPDLEFIGFAYSSLRFPEIAHLTKLKHFETRGCYGEVPDFTDFSTLEYLEIHDPQEDFDFNVDVSNCRNLEELIISNTTGAVAGVAQNTKLRRLELWTWQDRYNSTNAEMLKEAIPVLCDLEELNIEGQYVGSLNLANNTKLHVLKCNYNDLSSLDLSNNTQLYYLNCIENNITELVLPSSVREILCWSNPLGDLDVSGLPDLEVLCTADAGLTVLDVTHNPKLRELAFNGNSLGSIDLSSNPDLEEIACWDSDLTSLDLSHNPKLTWLRCWGNYLTTLDVSHNPKLGYRDVTSQNQNDNGLYCRQRDDANGINLLQTLYIAEGQVIPFVTENRSEDHIPSTTTIKVAPGDGGIGDYGGNTEEP